MKEGIKVQIRPSYDLIEMRLMPLSFLYGIVREMKYNSCGEIRGCWIELEEAYMDEKEWYIPISSLINE